MEKLRKVKRSAYIASTINGVFLLIALLAVSIPCGQPGMCGPTWPLYLAVAGVAFAALLPQILLYNFTKSIEENGEAATEHNRYILPILEVLKYVTIILFMLAASFT